tara:strand:- start:3677 stop:3979 length:303 start_codon:yes stop_codon:yes gene_type:complete
MQEKYDEYMQLEEERIERTADAWDEMAEAFFKRHGWAEDHMAYDTDRGTGTLWVKTDLHHEVWKDTGISAKEADRLLTSGWDDAEYIGFTHWLAEQEEDE